MNEQIKQRTDKKLLENQQKGQHLTTINRREYIVNEDVFSPQVFLGTEWLTNRVIDHLRGESFLQIGVGCGCALAEVALTKRCAVVVGCDINPAAVENTKRNLAKYELQGQLFVSDVLDQVPEQLKFSTIYWNYPFHPTDNQNGELTMLERAVRDHNYEGLEKLLKCLKTRLLPGGTLLLGFSSTMGDLPLMSKMVDAFEYQLQLAAQVAEQGKIMCLIQITIQPPI